MRKATIGGHFMNYIRITKDNIDKEHICCAMSGKQSDLKKEWMKHIALLLKTTLIISPLWCPYRDKRIAKNRVHPCGERMGSDRSRGIYLYWLPVDCRVDERTRIFKRFAEWVYWLCKGAREKRDLHSFFGWKKKRISFRSEVHGLYYKYVCHFGIRLKHQKIHWLCHFGTRLEKKWACN